MEHVSGPIGRVMERLKQQGQRPTEDTMDGDGLFNIDGDPVPDGPPTILNLPLRKVDHPHLRLLRCLMATHPLLNDGGYGLPARVDHRAAVLREWRADLLLNVEKVAWVENWLRLNVRPVKHPPRHGIGSYGMKHLVEREHPSGYITNGTLIAAALLAGYTADLRDYNPIFGFSKRCIDRIMNRINDARRSR